MIGRMLSIISLAFLLTQFAFSQTERPTVDFKIDSVTVMKGEIEISYEWMNPKDFLERELKLIDLVNAASISPGSNQLVASKLVFVSQKRFEEFSYQKMNTSDYISGMLNSSAITQKEEDSWSVTNKVKAYGLPFKVRFDLKFAEMNPTTLPHQLVKYFRSETSAFEGSGKETFLTLDMTNFSQLIYRNYSVVYLKELQNGTTLVLAGVIAAIDIKKANTYFNIPPISRTEPTMMGNMRRQILHMANEIQN